MPSSGRWMALFAGEFRRLRAASYFAHGGTVTNTPPGTAPDEHFVLIVAFPRTPLRGLPLGAGGKRGRFLRRVREGELPSRVKEAGLGHASVRRFAGGFVS